MIKPQDLVAETCHIVIINEVTDTRQEFLSPQSPKDAERNVVAVEQGWLWANWGGEETRDDLAVVIHKSDDSITVRWWCCGDPETARELMADVLSGRWEEGLLQ